MGARRRETERESLRSPEGAAPAPAVVIEGLSKFYPQPFALGGRFRSWFISRREDPDDDAETLDEDVADGEVEDELEEEPPPLRTGDTWALRDIDLVVERGASVALIGNNGAGKTTLLRVLARAVPPTTGRVALYCRVSPFLSLASQFVQPEQTGREAVYALARFFEIPTHVVERRLDAVAAFAEFGDQIDRKVKTYSSGMVSRLAFSAVVNLDPEILLADQVVAVGDRGFRARCLDRVKEIAQSEETTLILATHDMKLARQLCDQAVWLHDGRLRAIGDTADVCADYERSVDLEGGTATPSSGADDGPPGFSNEHVRLLAVGLFSTRGEPLMNVRTDEDALLEMRLDVLPAGASVRCIFVLLRSTGPRIRAAQPERFLAAESGEYTVTAFIPAGFLPPESYEVRAGIQVSVGDQQAALTRSGVLAFDAYEPAPEVRDDEEPGGLEEDQGSARTDTAQIEWDVEYAASGAVIR